MNRFRSSSHFRLSDVGGRASARTRRGTTATEFAITLPLFITLALAACDFGRVAHFHEVVSNASRTAAEHGGTRQFTTFNRDSWEQGVEQAAVYELQSIPDFDQSEMGFTLTTAVDADDILRVGVDVSYPFRTVVTWPGLPHEITLRRYVEYRQFR